jgi:hypothetical protein
MIKKPKILPWLAHTSGLPEARVEELWREALRHAGAETGAEETPAYWKAAHDRLMELIHAETATTLPAHFTPWAMVNTHLCMLPLVAANGLHRLAAFATRSRLLRRAA